MSKLPPQFNLAMAITGLTLSLAIASRDFVIAQTTSQSSSDADYSFRVSQDWYNCQQIGAEYQEILAFETANFYVNICVNGDRYFYSGEAKQGNLASIFLPAYPLANRKDYIAKNGNISYLISTSSSKNILVIRKNGRQIVVEKAVHLSVR